MSSGLSVDPSVSVTSGGSVVDFPFWMAIKKEEMGIVSFCNKSNNDNIVNRKKERKAEWGIQFCSAEG